MLRFFFALILTLHGLIHLMGFAKANKMAELPQLSGTFSKTLGAWWLVAALLFLVTVVSFWMKKEMWWMMALAAIVLSQVLIVMQWKDAKFGTIANIIALVGVVLAYGSWSFSSMVRQDLNAFLPSSLSPQTVMTKEMIAPLPPLVQQWLERSNAVGKEVVQVAHLTQTGEMRTKPDGKWITFDAEQWNTLDHPGFIWRSFMHFAPGIDIVGRDKYENGRGNMRIKLLSLFPIANSKGPEIDQGSMLRNLGEICWFPTAAVNSYIKWEQLDAFSAKATMTNGGITASGIFRFNTEGDILSFEAMRYYDRKTGATLEDWFIANTSWANMNGVRIPNKSEVTWKLKDGDYTWLKLELTRLDYNQGYVN